MTLPMWFGTVLTLPAASPEMVTHPRQFAGDPDASEDPRLGTGPRGEDDDDLEPAWYVAALHRWWLLILVGALVGAVIGFWQASRQPLRYQGVTTLLVVPPSQPGAAQVNAATFRAIVENGTLAAQVIEELKLQDSMSPYRFLERALAVEEIRGTNIVKVKVTLADPKLAAEASRRLAQKAILLAQQITQQDGVSVQEQLKRHVSDAAQRMQQAERELLEYKQHAQVELLKEDTEAQLRERADLLALVIDIESERARLTAAENEIKRQSPVLEVARTPAAEDALRRIPSAPSPRSPGVDKRLRTERTENTHEDPNRDTGKNQVNPQQLDLTNPFVNPVYQTLDFQIATSRSRIAALEKERDQVMNVKKLGGKELSQLSELYRREIQLGRLQASYSLATKVHNELAIRYEQSRTQPVGNTSQLQVVDQALPPDEPVTRKRLQSGMLGAGMGFIGTALIVLLWESRSRRTTLPSA